MSIKHGKGSRSQTGGFTLIELITVVTIVGVLAIVVLPICNSYMVKSKLTGTTTVLDITRITINGAYSPNSGIFSSTSSPPIITQAVVSDAQYATGIKYSNPGTGSGVGVVVTLGNTDNVQIDDRYLGMFGTGKADGAAVWICAIAQTVSDPASGAAIQSMYPYLSAACQN